VLSRFKPRLVGLSAMTFQFDTLVHIAEFIRAWDPSIRLAAGGYHVTLMAEEVTQGGCLPLDFLIREEGELTFRNSLPSWKKDRPHFGRVLGLSYRKGDRWVHNPGRPLADLGALPLPNRKARLSNEFFMFNKSMDVAETSRGCPHACKFCSITNMYGRTFRRFPLPRIIADLRAIRDQGTRAVFLSDDNITYDIEHFRSVCRAIAASGLNGMEFTTQASAAGLANNPDLVKDMADANFRVVFVGFESMDGKNLMEMRKPTTPDINRRAAALLRSHGMGIIAGVIFGFPSDTEESIRQNYRLMKQLKPDLIYSQYLTPYPKTLLRKEMLDAGLVTNVDEVHTVRRLFLQYPNAPSRKP